MVRVLTTGTRNMYSVILVGIGGALGSVARYLCALGFAIWTGGAFPWGTLFVNVIGSFVIGFFFMLTTSGGRWLVSPDWRVFVTVGICGGFTTFSSLSLQTLLLLRDREWLLAGLNAFGSLALCMIAVFLGVYCASMLNARA